MRVGRTLAVTLAYVGIVLPGWVVAARYEPPPPVDPPKDVATGEVIVSRLFDEWRAAGAVRWADSRTIAVPDPTADIKVEIGDPIASGDLIYEVPGGGGAIALACETPPVSVRPGESGRPFVGCVQQMLIDGGATIDEGERASEALGPTTRTALAEFLRGLNVDVALTEPNVEELIEDARFALELAQLDRQGLPPEASPIDVGRADLTVGQRQRELDRLENSHGVILAHDDWISIPGGEAVVTAIDEPSGSGRVVTIGAGVPQVAVVMPVRIETAVDRTWEVEGGAGPIAAEEMALRDAGSDPLTGAPQVEALLAVAVDEEELPPGTEVRVRLVANDTGEAVPSVPGGALFGTVDDGHVEVLQPDGEWRRVDVSGSSMVAGRLVLADGVVAEAATVRMR